uniref:Uncharacterized protein n=1 Tax=Picea glauca TaxID=3330 RepID=A0A101LX41_PICGL|nr:hypothetical protein ABT39_MTgene6399 [Picea glauca]
MSLAFEGTRLGIFFPDLKGKSEGQQRSLDGLVRGLGTGSVRAC